MKKLFVAILTLGAFGFLAFGASPAEAHGVHFTVHKGNPCHDKEIHIESLIGHLHGGWHFGSCPSPSPSGSPSPTPTATPTSSPESTATPSASPTVTSAPTDTPQPEYPLSPAGAPQCQGTPPSTIPNAWATRVGQTNVLIAYWPTVIGGQVNVRYREVGSTEWQHALRDYPNLGIAPLGLLKEGMKYEYQIANGHGCNQSAWSKVFGPF